MALGRHSSKGNVLLSCAPLQDSLPPGVLPHSNSNSSVHTTGSQPSSNLAFLMSGFRFWGSSCASERNWISLPLPIKQDTMIYHLQCTTLCIYISSTKQSSRSFCTSLLHNSITEMLCTDTGYTARNNWAIHLIHSNMGSQSISQRFQHGFTKIKLHSQTSLLTFYEEGFSSKEQSSGYHLLWLHWCFWSHNTLTECWMSSEKDWKLHGQAQRVVIS